MKMTYIPEDACGEGHYVLIAIWCVVRLLLTSEEKRSSNLPTIHTLKFIDINRFQIQLFSGKNRVSRKNKIYRTK